MVLRGAGERLIWMTIDASAILGHVPQPSFDPGYPDSVDIEEASADLKGIFGVTLESDVEQIRKRKKRHYARGNFAQFDAHGRLWLLTNRPSLRPSETLLDIYQDTTLLGSLAVPGRVLAFRLYDSLLVTMTRSVAIDSTGMHERRFNWYRVWDGGL